MTRALVLAAVLLALAAGAASAKPFQRTDRNGNDVVEYDEARRAYPGISQGQFQRMDMNRDGVIDRNEYPQLDSIWELLIRAQ
jgi:hypothetical protein